MNNGGHVDAEFSQRMARVSASYRKNLAGVLEDLIALQDRARKQDNMASVADAVGQIAHRVAGSAGLFGFGDVGEAADQVEAALHTARHANINEPMTEEALAALDQFLDTLRKALS